MTPIRVEVAVLPLTVHEAAGVTALSRWLDGAECARAATFVSPVDSQLFVAAHALARLLLSELGGRLGKTNEDLLDLGRAQVVVRVGLEGYVLIGGVLDELICAGANGRRLTGGRLVDGGGIDILVDVLRNDPHE